MSRPNLQIALDHNYLEHALGDVMKVGDVVDVETQAGVLQYKVLEIQRSN